MKTNNLLLRNLLLCVLLFCTLLASGQFTVNGSVVDATSNEPLIGTNILIKGTGSGTITDYDGKFSLQVNSPNDTLIVSYTGYNSQEIPVQGRAIIDVLLATQINVLDEIVVVGYGVQRKSDLTGSISTVKGDDLKRIPSGNVEQMLQGKVAGVLVTPSSGEPGAGAVVRIRGTGTLNDASPLYVVDNMLLNDISFLNPNDVESIEVLKDASATAIYGCRGANGYVNASIGPFWD